MVTYGEEEQGGGGELGGRTWERRSKNKGEAEGRGGWVERKWAGDADCGAVGEGDGEGKQQKKAEENMTEGFKVQYKTRRGRPR